MTKRENSESDSSSIGTASDESEMSDQSEVQVEFEFKEPEELDFHGLKSLLVELFKADELNYSMLAELIMENPLTTVVKAEGNLDPFAVVTLIDASNEKYSQLVNYFKSLSSNSEFRECWSKRVGIVVNTRLLNMPPHIVPPMFRILQKDLQIDLDYLIFVSKAYLTVEKRSKKKSKMDKQYLYFQVEDEFLDSQCVLKVDYEIKNQQASGSRRVFNDYGIEQSRRLLIVKADGLNQLITTWEEVMAE